MLKIKRGLMNILEKNNESEEAAPLQPPQLQTPQSVRTTLKLNELETPQPPQLLRSTEPAVQAPQPPAPAPAEDWGELLIKLLATAPGDVAQKLTACIDREMLMKVLEKRDDPYLRVALLLLTKK